MSFLNLNVDVNQYNLLDPPVPKVSWLLEGGRQVVFGVQVCFCDKTHFEGVVQQHNYNADQTRFLRTVQQVFLQRGKLELNDLYEHPFSQFGVNAVERLFGDYVNKIIEIIK